jgi:hypothetical protein
MVINEHFDGEFNALRPSAIVVQHPVRLRAESGGGAAIERGDVLNASQKYQLQVVSLADPVNVAIHVDFFVPISQIASECETVHTP